MNSNEAGDDVNMSSQQNGTNNMDSNSNNGNGMNVEATSSDHQ